MSKQACPNPPSLRGLLASEYASSVPSRYWDLYIKASNGTASPKKAIKAMCQHCVGYEDVPSRVGGCTVSKCPLWAYRPYQETK